VEQEVEEEVADSWGFRRIVGHEQDASGALRWRVVWAAQRDGDDIVTWDDSWEPTSSLEGTGLGQVHGSVRRARLADALLSEVCRCVVCLIVSDRTMARSSATK
jgi:hypothetical protein